MKPTNANEQPQGSASPPAGDPAVRPATARKDWCLFPDLECAWPNCECSIRAAVSVEPVPAVSASVDLGKALRDLIHAYVILLETARERIIFHGGTCDSLEVMERGDPYLARARTALRDASRLTSAGTERQNSTERMNKSSAVAAGVNEAKP